MVFLQLPKLTKAVVTGTGLHSVPQISQALFLLLKLPNYIGRFPNVYLLNKYLLNTYYVLVIKW